MLLDQSYKKSFHQIQIIHMLVSNNQNYDNMHHLCIIGKVDVSAWNDVSIDLLDTKLLTFTQESVVTISLVTIKKDPEEDGFTFMKFNVYSK